MILLLDWEPELWLSEPVPGGEQGPWETLPQGWERGPGPPETLELPWTPEPDREQGPLAPEPVTQSWTPPEPTGWNTTALEALWLGTMGLLEKYLPSEMGGPAAKEGTPGEPLTGLSLVKYPTG